jgi:regulator of cell morphogenesis and NO signaling
MQLREQLLGDLALSIPGAPHLFRKYNLDYCCGSGKKTLSEVATQFNLNVDEIESQLKILSQKEQERDWKKAPLSEMIDYIISRYHEKHREQLPELIFQAEKVERKHADNPNVPKGLTEYLITLSEELNNHMMKEEQILFPMIKNGMGKNAQAPISVMEQEHQDAGQILEEIKRVTHNVSAPKEACNTWKALYNGVNVIIEDLMNHINLENTLLFPRALRGEE